MSWNAIIFAATGYSEVSDMPKDYIAESLGEARFLRDKLAAFFGGLDWSDPSYGRVEVGETSFEFHLAGEGKLEQIGLRVTGRGDAITPILALCDRYGWQAIDSSTGEFIEVETARGSWEAWVSFRDRNIPNPPTAEN